MKKRNRAVLVTAFAAALLAACGTAGRETVSEELVAPEVSSEDLLVSSLEYLLEEDGTEAPEAEEAEVRDGFDEENRTRRERR